jgi:hypothetical protein
LGNHPSPNILHSGLNLKQESKRTLGLRGKLFAIRRDALAPKLSLAAFWFGSGPSQLRRHAPLAPPGDGALPRAPIAVLIRSDKGAHIQPAAEMMSDCPEVRLLRDKIDQLEQERRFEGNYPKGMARFPGKLTGQGFFPGGDGLWRDDVQGPSTSPFPVGGIMFLGNDFGTLESFKKDSANGF